MKQFASATRLTPISISVFVLVTLSLTAPSQAGTVGLNDAHLAVWRLHNDKPIQNPKFKKYDVSTGFYLSPRHLILTAHSLRALVLDKRVPIPELVVTRGQGANAVIRHIDRVLRLSEIHDLALVTTKERQAHWLKVAPNSRQLTDLTAIGYPGGGKQRTMRQVGRASRDHLAWEFELPVDVNELASASGSPVLDVHGRVVGVMFRAFSNVATVLCVERLRAFGWHEDDTRWVSCGNRSFRRCHEATIENVRERARNGDTIAQLRHWYLYQKGTIDGGPAVIHSLKEAARGGLRKAQFSLALAYHEGDLVGADRKMRDLWYRRAAEQDDPLAQFNMAVNFESSQPTRARAILRLLADRGVFPARERLKKMQ